MSQSACESWMDRLGRMNRPRFFGVLLERAGVDLDRALFGLLVWIQSSGPIGVTELSELLGIDHSTASRQLARLEELELIGRRPAEHDQRVRQAVLTGRGEAVVAAINQARRELIDEALADWPAGERAELDRLMDKLTASMGELIDRETGCADTGRPARAQTA